MYYWCGWSRFTVNTLLRDFQSQNCVTLHPGGVRQHRAGHHNLAHCSLLEATGCHASSCSMHHHASASCIMSHARNPRIFACVCCFGILIRSVIPRGTQLIKKIPPDLKILSKNKGTSDLQRTSQIRDVPWLRHEYWLIRLIEKPLDLQTYCTGQAIPTMPYFGSAPPLFLEDENIFQKSARVVRILLQFRTVPREPIFELHL